MSHPYERINAQILDAFNTGNLAALDRLIAPTALDHGAPPGMPGGLEGVKMFAKNWHGAFPDGRFTVEDTAINGDRLFCRATFKGTHTGALMGIAPTGKKVSLTCVDSVRFAGDLAVEHWGGIDSGALLQQLGVAPAGHAATIGKIYEAFGKGDVEFIVAQVADNVDWDNSAVSSADCPWNGNFSGKKNVPAFFKAIAETLDFHAFEPRLIIEQGNQVATHLHFDSTVKKTGRRIVNDSMHIFTFDAQGKISRYRHFNDTGQELAAWRG